MLMLADYDLATEMGNLLAGNPLTLTAEDSLSYNNEVWFGANVVSLLIVGK